MSVTRNWKIRRWDISSVTVTFVMRRTEGRTHRLTDGRREGHTDWRKEGRTHWLEDGRKDTLTGGRKEGHTDWRKEGHNDWRTDGHFHPIRDFRGRQSASYKEIMNFLKIRDWAVWWYLPQIITEARIWRCDDICLRSSQKPEFGGVMIFSSDHQRNPKWAVWWSLPRIITEARDLLYIAFANRHRKEHTQLYPLCR